MAPVIAATRVVVVGQGYVGLPVAVRAVEAGFTVVGLDVDKERIEDLRSGRSYVQDVSDERLADALASDRYHPTDDASAANDFDIAVISVPTPLREGTPDLSYIEAAARALAPHLRPGAAVVLESTTYPGTTEELIGPLLEGGSGLTVGADFHLGYSPERIDPGNLTWTFENTPKVVSGVDAESLEVIRWFYDALVDTTVVVDSPRVAELTKLLENTFRHVNIALVNELAIFAHALGIDVWDAIDAASTKPFGYMRFTPGPGVGGHCLPVDPSYLSWQVKQRLGLNFRFVELANDVNDHMPDYVIRRIVLHLNGRKRAVNGSRVLVLGLAYKRNTGDARESPSTAIVDRLVGLGADVRVSDPHVDPRHQPLGAELVEATEAEVRAADLVLVLVDHDRFDLARLVPHATAVFDTRRCVAGVNVEHL